MNHYLDVFSLDQFSPETTISLEMLREMENEQRFGPCEDDYESTCELMYYLPAESNHEEGSPISFRPETYGLLTDSYIDQMIQEAYLQGD